MKADSLNAKDLFAKQFCPAVSRFQRLNNSNQYDQWVHLWDEVQHATDRYLMELGRTHDLGDSPP